MTKAIVFGRAWVYDAGDPIQFDLWEHEFQPMEAGRRSGWEWCYQHLCECYSDNEIRELFSLPKTGNFQVLFKGTIIGFVDRSFDGEEWDEQFDLDECKSMPIPAGWDMLHRPARRQHDIPVSPGNPQGMAGQEADSEGVRCFADA